MIELDSPQCTEAGSDVLIKFFTKPADVEVFNPHLKRALTEDNGTPSREFYRVDLKKGEIFLPNVQERDTGTYIFCCNDDCSATFDLTILPRRKCEKYTSVTIVTKLDVYCCLVSILLSVPESIRVGDDAVINFSVQPADLDMLDAQLKRISSNQDDDTPPLLVSTGIYTMDLKRGKIIFPEMREENAGTYLLICNGDCSKTFNLKVTPNRCEKVCS